MGVTPERARLEAAYAAHGRAVLAYAMRRTDPDTASDVLSEVFLAAWRRIDELPAEPLPWLLGTARRVLANQRRGEARRSALTERIEGGHVGWVPSAADEVSDRAVLDALTSLAETDREALMLVAWDGLAPREAAEVLGMRPPAFTMRLSRARRRLAAALEAAGDGELLPEVARGR